MKTTFLTGLAAAAALASPSVVAAQDTATDTTTADVFVVASVGYHDIGLDTDDLEDLDLEIDDASLIYGAVAGFDVPLGDSGAFIGAEANYHFGNDVIDGEYGVAARVGFRSAGGTKFYARGGYQWINLDPAEVIADDDIDFPAGTFDGIDDVQGDFLLGVGADGRLGNFLIRGTVDTVSFDTLRATVGIGFAF